MEMSADNNAPVKPIFVVGYMHSGTTLLLNILARHPSVFASRGETKFFMRLPMIRSRFGRLDEDDVLRDYVRFVMGIISADFDINKGFDAVVEGCPFTPAEVDEVVERVRSDREHCSVFARAFAHLAEKGGRRFWLEKTPTHIFHIDQIARSLPEARFVEIVRDPRDILASKKTRKESVWKGDRYSPERRHLKHLEKAYDPLWDSLSWKSAVRAGAQARRRWRDKVISVRYEDLVCEPELKVRELCAALGLDFEPEMLSVSSGNPADWRQKASRAGREIAADSVGRWGTVLTPSEVALSQALLRGELARLGYRPAPVSLAARAGVALLLARSPVEFFNRLLRRWQLGGFRYMVNISTNYWRRLLKLIHA